MAEGAATGVPRIGILALQGDVREHRATLQRLGAEVALVRSAAELDVVDGLVIPGGESSTMWRLAKLTGLVVGDSARPSGQGAVPRPSTEGPAQPSAEGAVPRPSAEGAPASRSHGKPARFGFPGGPLPDAVRNGLPVLGTCAGLIMLAANIADAAPGQRGLGLLDVTVHRNAFGSQLDSFETDLPMPAVADDSVRVAFIRAPIVKEVGAGVEVMGTLPDGRIVAVRQGNVIGCSFHPELTGDDRLHRYFLDVVAGRAEKRAA